MEKQTALGSELGLRWTEEMKSYLVAPQKRECNQSTFNQPIVRSLGTGKNPPMICEAEH